MNYYKVFEDVNGNKYSCDMIRLNCDFGNETETFVGYLQKLSTFDLRYEIKHHDSFKPFTYRHMWTIEIPIDEISFCIGLDLGRNADDRTKGFIEFNPNKCMSSTAFQELWNTVIAKTFSRTLVRYDLAIDIPLARHLVKLVQDKRYYRLDRFDSVTEYLGKRSNDGFCKLYDKQAESKLNVPLTRLEMTLEPKSSAADHFPTVWLYDEDIKIIEYGSELSATDIVLIKLLRQVDEPMVYFKDLSWFIRKKIEPYLADRTLTLDTFSAYEVFKCACSFEY